MDPVDPDSDPDPQHWSLSSATCATCTGTQMCLTYHQCFGSGFGLDPDSIESVDPDPGGQK